MQTSTQANSHSDSLEEKQSAVWEHKRIWYAPKAHSLVQSSKCVELTGNVDFEIALGCAKSAYLWDHKVSLIWSFHMFASEL